MDVDTIKTWKVESPAAEGMHAVIVPGQSDCRVVEIYRLNLAEGNKHELISGKLEMNAALVNGKARVLGAGLDEVTGKYDSFYIPGGTTVTIEALEDTAIYIGAAPCEGYGKVFFRKYDPGLPVGKVHQVHGEGAARREVFFTLDEEVPASRLLCGFTWSQDGAWTSWPPHQHENDLEEAYCYFDIKDPHRVFHISYCETGDLDHAVFHPAKEGTIVLAPRGYHPTVAAPGVVNSYFWVLAAFSHESRRYTLSISDPNY